MAIKEIVKDPNPVLHIKCSKYNDFENINSLVEDLRDTMIDNKGLGLASPQINIPVRVAIVSVSQDLVKERNLNEKFGEYILINPKIISRSKLELIEIEGCLSLPKIEVNVPRTQSVEILTQDLNSNRIRISLSGILARVAQHEIDHLNGKLITDYVRENSK